MDGYLSNWPEQISQAHYDDGSKQKAFLLIKNEMEIVAQINI